MIEVKNNWEYITFWNKGKELKSISKVDIQGEIYSVKKTETSKTYYDHGHIGNSRFPDYLIVHKVFGKSFEFRLSSLIEDHKIKIKFIE